MPASRRQLDGTLGPSFAEVLGEPGWAELRRRLRAAWLSAHRLEAAPPDEGAVWSSACRFLAAVTYRPLDLRAEAARLEAAGHHGEVLYRAGRPAAFVAQPTYGECAAGLAVVEQHWREASARFGCVFTCSTADSWRHPGRTALLALWIAAEAPAWAFPGPPSPEP